MNFIRLYQCGMLQTMYGFEQDAQSAAAPSLTAQTKAPERMNLLFLIADPFYFCSEACEAPNPSGSEVVSATH